MVALQVGQSRLRLAQAVLIQRLVLQLVVMLVVSLSTDQMVEQHQMPQSHQQAVQQVGLQLTVAPVAQLL